MAEIWDLYDKDFNKIEGASITRGEAIPAGRFHLVGNVLVRHEDGTYLIMLRDRAKKHGGMWEASAGGSALKGETPIQCAARELAEESGIVCKGASGAAGGALAGAAAGALAGGIGGASVLTGGPLKDLGVTVNEKSRTIYAEYLCVVSGPKDAVRLQKGETTAFKWVSKEELLALSLSELLSGRAQERVRRGLA